MAASLYKNDMGAVYWGVRMKPCTCGTTKDVMRKLGGGQQRPRNPTSCLTGVKGDLRKGSLGKQRASADHGIGWVEKAMRLGAQEMHPCMHHCLVLT